MSKSAQHKNARRTGVVIACVTTSAMATGAAATAGGRWRGLDMRGLMRHTVVVAGAGVILLGPVAGVASAAGGASAGSRPAAGDPGWRRGYLGHGRGGSRHRRPQHRRQRGDPCSVVPVGW